MFVEAWDVAVGWPMLAWSAEVVEDPPPLRARGGVLVPGLGLGATIPNTPQRVLIPLTPILGGLIVDTVFYAVLLAAGVELYRSLRRRVRLARGRCGSCGYDLAGLDKCPECGKGVAHT